jgi:hypothetical protein
MDMEVTICRIGPADPARNVYDLAAAEAIIREFGKKGGTLYGQQAAATVGTPSSTVDLIMVTHVVKDMWIAGRELRAKVKLLNTLWGRGMKKIVDEGHPLKFTPRVIGRLLSNSTFNLQAFVSVDVDVDTFYPQYYRRERLEMVMALVDGINNQGGQENG